MFINYYLSVSAVTKHFSVTMDPTLQNRIIECLIEHSINPMSPPRRIKTDIQLSIMLGGTNATNIVNDAVTKYKTHQRCVIQTELIRKRLSNHDDFQENLVIEPMEDVPCFHISISGSSSSSIFNKISVAIPIDRFSNKLHEESKEESKEEDKSFAIEIALFNDDEMVYDESIGHGVDLRTYTTFDSVFEEISRLNNIATHEKE